MAKYSDVQLIQILQKAARRINRRLRLFDTTDEVVVDGGGNITSPDDDGALEDLVLLQAECMISQRNSQEALLDGTDGIRIVDGEQTFDSTVSAIARGTFYNSPHSPCAELKEAIALENITRSGNSGRLVW